MNTMIADRNEMKQCGTGNATAGATGRGSLRPVQVSPRRKKLRYNPEGQSDELLHPRQAAVDMEPEFRSIARQLAPRDKSTQDDLVQEMALAALLIDERQTRSFFRLAACWRARDYLRWWRFKLDDSPDTKNENLELTSGELERCAASLNRLLGHREAV